MIRWMVIGLVLAAPAVAQGRGTIARGMTEAEVRTAFGEPTVRREAASRAYLFYANGCPIKCGSDDVVFLENGRVVTAVLRSPGRHFAGPAVTGLPDGTGTARPSRRTAVRHSEAPPRTEGVRLRVPGSERTSVGAGSPRRIVVGPRAGELGTPADGFRSQRSATTDTIRGPLQRADTAAALSPPAPVPGTPPASATPARPQQQQPPRPPR